MYYWTSYGNLQAGVYLVQKNCLPTESPRVHQLLTPRGWMSQLVFCVRQNPEIGSNASDRMTGQPEGRQGGKEQMLPSFMSFILASTKRHGPDLRWILPPPKI